MTLVINSLGAVPARGQWAQPVLDQLQRDKAYLFIIFGMLAAWGLGVHVLYEVVGGPPITASERATKFATRLVNRTIIFALAFVVIRFIQHERSAAEGSLFKNVWSAIRLRPADYVFIPVYALIAALSFTWLQTNFMSAKTAIPMLTDYWLDPMARKWDIAIFGQDPWKYFAWIYDYPLAVQFVDRLYMYWAALIAGFWMWALCSRRMERTRRWQYIIAMLLIWFVAGNVLATLLASVGPVYYEEFFGDPALFAPLMAELHAISADTPLRAVNYQSYLLHYYHHPETRFGGISAIPSLHVGTSLMMLFLFWRTRIAREALIAFNIIIYVGSIILGWHYGVDGLIALPIALACWWCAGRIVAAVERRTLAQTAESRF